jgi:excisionase family DNA binding protein
LRAQPTIAPFHPESYFRFLAMEEKELTTSEAAEVLNVSHRYLLNLLEEGEIPFHDEGTCLLIQQQKLLEYKRRQRAVAEEAMQKLTDQAQKLGLGY